MLVEMIHVTLYCANHSASYSPGFIAPMSSALVAAYLWLIRSGCEWEGGSDSDAGGLCHLLGRRSLINTLRTFWISLFRFIGRYHTRFVAEISVVWWRSVARCMSTWRNPISNACAVILRSEEPVGWGDWDLRQCHQSSWGGGPT